MCFIDPRKWLSRMCCFLLLILISVPVILTSCFFWMIYNRATCFVIYENLPIAKAISGATNESFCYIYFETYIEADMSPNAFDEYVKLEYSKLVDAPFFPIAPEGIVVFCYRFMSIHPSQKNSYDSSDKSKKINCYEHHVANGYYSIEERDDNILGWVTVYDSKNQRIFRYRSHGMTEEFYREPK